MACTPRSEVYCTESFSGFIGGAFEDLDHTRRVRVRPQPPPPRVWHNLNTLVVTYLCRYDR